MPIGTWINTLLSGHCKGKDDFGNRYYQARYGKKRRWVIYNGIVEASKVPPEWHGWLHYTVDQTPIENPVFKWKWVKPALPNLTGTKSAYCPKGDLRVGGKRSPVSADYQPWQSN